MSDKFLGTLRVDLVAFAAGLEQGLDRASRRVEKFGRNTERQYRKIGRSLTTNITLPILAAGTATVFASDKIAKAQRDIQVATGATGEDLESLNTTLSTISREMPDSFGSISSVIGTLNTQTGDLGEGLEELTSIVLAGSRLMGEDATQSASSLGRVLRQFNADADEGVDIYARLYTNAQKYDVTITKQLENVRNYGPVLSNANLTLSEQIDLFARLESVGIDVSRVMPGINQAIRLFADANLDANDSLVLSVNAIRDAKTETEALSLASKIFGSEGAARLTRAIRDEVFAFEDLGQSISMTGEDLLEFEKNNRDFGEKASQIGNRILIGLEPLGSDLIDILEDAEPMLMSLVDIAEDLVSRFSDLPAPTRNTIIGITGLLAVAGPAATALGFMVGNTSTLIALSLETGGAIVGMTKNILKMNLAWDASGTSLGTMIGTMTKFLAVSAGAFAVGTFLSTEIKMFEVGGAKIVAGGQLIWIELRRLWNWGTNELSIITLDFFEWVTDLIGDSSSGFISGLAGALSLVAPSASAALNAAAPAVKAAVDGFWATSGLTKDGIRVQMQDVSASLDAETIAMGEVLEASLAEIEKKYSDPDRKLGSSFADTLRSYIDPVGDMLSDVLGGSMGLDAMIESLRGVRDEMDGLLDSSSGSAISGIPEDIGKITGSIDGLLRALGKVKDEGDEIGDKFDEVFKERLLDAVEGWSRGASQSFTDFLFDAETAFDDVVESFARMLAQMVIQQLIFAPLLGAFRNYLGLSASGSGGGEAGAVGVNRNSKGSVWSNGLPIQRNSKGSVFRNLTRFTAANGQKNTLAENAPEGLVPLKTMGDGSLGVGFSGSAGASTVVNIIDQRRGGEDVSVSERTGPGGERELTILVRDKVKEMIGSGELDRTMRGSYGLKRTGTNR